MKRLTCRSKDGRALLAPEFEGRYTEAELVDILLGRLCGYEESGLDPEEIPVLQHTVEITRRACLPIIKASDHPIMPGDKIYRIEKHKGITHIAEHTIEKIEVFSSGVSLCFGWKNCGYECVDTEYIGEVIFLNPEDAVAAMYAKTRKDV